MNKYTSLRCYDLGSADFNVLLLMFLKNKQQETNYL
jgi:hypothetical protein